MITPMWRRRPRRWIKPGRVSSDPSHDTHGVDAKLGLSYPAGYFELNSDGF